MIRADAVIHLDFPRWRCLARVLFRILSSFDRVRADLAEGCPQPKSTRTDPNLGVKLGTSSCADPRGGRRLL